MYQYFDDKKLLSEIRAYCSDIVSNVVNESRNRGIKCDFFLIGSGAKNLVTFQKRRDGKIIIDFDYNVKLLSNEDINNEKATKETVRKAFNVVLNSLGFQNGAKNGTSSLGSPEMIWKDNPQIVFSIDIGIVYCGTNGTWYRLIRNKRIRFA